MWPLQIVDRAPAVEGALHFRQSAERAQSKYFRFQAAMEAFVLAPALGMTRPSMHHSDAELEQPHLQRSLATLSRCVGRNILLDAPDSNDDLRPMSNRFCLADLTRSYRPVTAGPS